MTVSKDIESEIRRLHHAEGWPIHTIATQLEVHHSVVERVLSQEVQAPRPRPRLIDDYVGFVRETLATYPRLGAGRMHDMLRARGFAGSARTVRREVRRLRPPPTRETFLRLHHIPGVQAQVDWAFVGHLDFQGTPRKLWLFVGVLAYSRALFAEFVLDLSVDGLRRSLRRMGEHFGGHPREWLFDNAKTVVVQRYGHAVRLHPLLMEASAHYCVQAKLCTPRRAQEKGIVERAIRYLRTRFLAGRKIPSVARGNEELRTFIEEIAHPRTHPRLAGRTVAECFAEERPKLLALPEHPLCTDTLKPAVVDKTAFVVFQTNLYSVDPKATGRPVTVVADDAWIRIVDQDEEVGRHPRCWARKQVLEDPKHRDQILQRKAAAEPAKGIEHLRRIAPAIDTLIEGWIERGHNLGSVVSRAQRLVELYGHTLFARAVEDVVGRNLLDVSAIAVQCEHLRKHAQSDVPIDVPLGDHVPERDVIPHDLETYDGNT